MHVDEASRASGQPLDAATLAYMGPRLGHDFSNVRVHADAQAAVATSSVNARAFTVGQHIYFGAGQLQPGGVEGNRLLAHELVHTVQQAGTPSSPVLQRSPAGAPSAKGSTTAPAPGAAYAEEEAFLAYAMGAKSNRKLAAGVPIHKSNELEATGLSSNSFYVGPFTSDMGQFYYVYRFTSVEQTKSTFTRGSARVGWESTKDRAALIEKLKNVEASKTVELTGTGLTSSPLPKDTGAGAGHGDTAAGGGQGDTATGAGQGGAAPKAGIGATLALDPVYQTEFNSIYNQAAGAWTFLAQKQVLAIESVYTEAKKPTKPDLVTELMISLALAALGGAVNVIGSSIAIAIEKRALAELGKRLVQHNGNWFYQVGSKTWRMTYDLAKVKEIQEGTKYWARMISEGAKDFFKDGVKSFVGPHIRTLLEAKKKPIDAFFEGLKEATVDAGREAFKGAEGQRSAVLASAPDPISAAATEAAAMDDIYALATETQKYETTRHWLAYQAQSRMGTALTGKVVDGEQERGTNMAALPALGTFKSVVNDFVPGVIYIDYYINRDGQTRDLGKRRLPGLSASMLKSIGNTPIRELGLPFVIRVTNKYGSSEPPDSSAGEEWVFIIKRNEKGAVSTSRLLPRHQAVLAKYVGAKPTEAGGWASDAEWNPSDVQRGAELIAEGASWMNLKGVEPDKD